MVIWYPSNEAIKIIGKYDSVKSKLYDIVDIVLGGSAIPNPRVLGLTKDLQHTLESVQLQILALQRDTENLHSTVDALSAEVNELRTNAPVWD